VTVQDVIQRALAAYDAGELDAYATCYAEDAVMIMNADQPVRGRAAIRRQAAAEKTAFPDMKLDRSLFVAEGEWVAWRWRLRGTHDGDYGPWAATHRTVDVWGSTHARVVDDLVAEMLVLTDRASMLAQLGR
jgi:ketosteroid isomerase-like protein